MTRSERSRLAGLLALTATLVLLAPYVVRAATDEVGARALFVEARRLAAAGNYKAACPKFEDSFRLDPGIGTNFNLADCYEHIGRIAAAWARFLDVAAATKAVGQPERERVARARAARIEPRLARLSVEVTTPAPGLSVVRDGIALGPSSWALAVPVDPGTHYVEASAPGRKTWKATVEVADAAGEVTIAVPELEQALMKSVVSSSPERRPVVTTSHSPAKSTLTSMPAGGSDLLNATVVFGAIGALSLATAAVFGIMFQIDNGNAKAICPTSTNCTMEQSTEHEALVHRSERDRGIALGSLAIGSTAVITAALSIWWRDTGRRWRSTAAPVSIEAVPFGPVGLGVSGIW